MFIATCLLVILCICITQLLRRGYDPMGWGIHLSVLGMGAAIIDSAWVRAWLSRLEPEPGRSLMSLPWGDISMVLLMVSMLCFALWIVQAYYHKEEPPMEDQ